MHHKTNIDLLLSTYNLDAPTSAPRLLTRGDIDREATTVGWIVAKCIEVAVPISRPSDRANHWWVESLARVCEEARRAATYADSHPDDLEVRQHARTARNHKKAAIKRAKYQYLRTLLSGVTDRMLWAMTWILHNKNTNSPPPPLLRPDGTFALSVLEKMELLKTYLLPEMSGADVRGTFEEAMGDRVGGDEGTCTENGTPGVVEHVREHVGEHERVSESGGERDELGEEKEGSTLETASSSSSAGRARCDGSLTAPSGRLLVSKPILMDSFPAGHLVSTLQSCGSEPPSHAGSFNSQNVHLVARVSFALVRAARAS
jgi:hypothetical protein